MLHQVKTTKKELFLHIFLICLILLNFATIYAFFLNGMVSYWFFISIFYISIFMFAKSVVFRSDSSLYLATLLLCFSVLGFALNGQNYSAFALAAFILMSFGVSHLVLSIFFGKIFHILAFIFYFLLFLPLILYSFYCINLPLMILLICGDVLGFLLPIASVKYG